MGRGVEVVHKRKLIEVALPLEAINRESAREKSIRHGHPSTLHLWWAWRPLAAARAVIFAQLVDDPSAKPEEFPTEELQRAERNRLHAMVERLVVWESARDEKLLAEAHAEILKSTNDDPPPIVDPFAGGGTIPLEAQRLGLVAQASDLNPVAVLINKAMIEIPPKFRDQTPVYPGLADSQIRNWKGAEGLAADVRAYGMWMRDEAEDQIGRYYPKAVLADGSEATVIAWIWARTVKCPNPACSIQLPLVKSWWLSKKRGKEAYVSPRIIGSPDNLSALRVEFEVVQGRVGGPADAEDGTVGRTGATCVSCGTGASLAYIREEGRAKRLGSQLMATVAEGNRRRHYVSPTSTHERAAEVEPPAVSVAGSLGHYPRDLKAPTYGFTEFSDLFTTRQLTALCTFADLVESAKQRVEADGGSSAYASAVATYLALSVSRCADYWSSICSWHNTGEKLRNVFGRQAIPMSWDYAEVMPFSESSGGYSGQLTWVAKVVDWLPAVRPGVVRQADAATTACVGAISTDPPYYDNIGYSDLSDFFYVWQRRMLRSIYPELFGTVLVPKAEELVANPYRHGSKAGAQEFFETGFQRVFSNARSSASNDWPITVYYAFKQSDADETGQTSTGWETLLEGMIASGWEITSTWPMRTESSVRLIGNNKNALASSIVLSLRPRPADARTTDRRGFIAAMEAELPDALRWLQQGQIAPVDLPQAAIGPGMAVFSRYGAVLEPDGTKMTVRSALARINEILDQVLNEQEGDFDSPTRFAIAWYRQHGYDVGAFGDANNLANARNTTVHVMDRDGILSSRAGKVQLIKPSDLSWEYDPVADLHTSNWEALHHLIKVLERDGITPAGDFLQVALSRPDGAVDADLVKELAHLLFRVAEANGWTKDALSFNSLVTSWPEILEVARSARKPTQTQGAFDFDEDN